MRLLLRNLVVASLLGLPLGGCGSMNFDPQDWLAGEWFSTKKPLPGERKPVFPEGVPGVARGVPSELVKGNQQAAGLGVQESMAPAPEATPPAAATEPASRQRPQAITPVREAAVQGEEPQPKAARPKPKAKPKPKPKVARTAEPEPGPQPAASSARPAPGWPEQQQQPQVQWPDPPAARPPQPQVQWPDPPPPR
jgi:hypothetical protein